MEYSCVLWSELEYPKRQPPFKMCRVVNGEIELLPLLYGSVILPEAVQRELLHPKAPDAVRRWAQEPPDWIEVRSV